MGWIESREEVHKGCGGSIVYIPNLDGKGNGGYGCNKCRMGLDLIKGQRRFPNESDRRTEPKPIHRHLNEVVRDSTQQNGSIAEYIKDIAENSVRFTSEARDTALRLLEDGDVSLLAVVRNPRAFAAALIYVADGKHKNLLTMRDLRKATGISESHISDISKEIKFILRLKSIQEATQTMGAQKLKN